MPLAERQVLLERVTALELAGHHRAAVALCEGALGPADHHDVSFALARNCFALAAGGDEVHAWPALYAAFHGLQQRDRADSQIPHIVNICRWVLDHFADFHRLNVRDYTTRSAAHSPPSAWWAGCLAGEGGGTGPAPPTVDELAARAKAGDHVGLCNAVLAAAPARARHGRDAAELAREAAYLLANAATALAPERAQGLLGAAEFPLPGDYDAQLYDRYLQAAARAHIQRLQATGAPTIFLTAIPRSASEFLSSVLADVFGTPVVRVTVGDPILGAVSARWVADALRGECVLHDHFAATPVNLAALREGGATAVDVLVRDPRAVFWSLERMQGEYDGPAAAPPDGADAARRVKLLAGWIDSWVQAAAGGFPVRFIRFRELIAAPAGVIDGLLTAYDARRYRGRMEEVLRERAGRPRASSNFHVGDDDAWRRGMPKATHPALWDAIPEGVRELLSLAP